MSEGTELFIRAIQAEHITKHYSTVKRSFRIAYTAFLPFSSATRLSIIAKLVVYLLSVNGSRNEINKTKDKNQSNHVTPLT